jgi:HEPN domain-containing protein/predicted nucleotidyltransferase
MADFTATAQPRLERIVDAIRERVSPELILLFGSRARGDAREDSDYDVMLVLPDGADVECHRRDASDALRAIGVSADVLATSVADYQRHQHDPGFLDWLVSREGVMLYSSGTVPQRSARPARVREEPREGLDMWIKRAEEDFRTAQLSIAAADPPLGPICFHAHPCVEKLLKAMIVKQGVHPLRTHELPEILALQPATIREDAEVLAACPLLDRLYPKSRYPKAPMPTHDEARRAFDSARLVRDRLLPLLTEN